MQDRGSGIWRSAVILHDVGVRDLPGAGFAAYLADRLADKRVALHVTLGRMSATRVHRQLPAQLDAATAHPLVACASFAEAKPFESENDRRREVIVDLSAFDLAGRNVGLLVHASAHVLTGCPPEVLYVIVVIEIGCRVGRANVRRGMLEGLCLRGGGDNERHATVIDDAVVE